jgi:hypothetical protein
VTPGLTCAKIESIERGALTMQASIRLLAATAAMLALSAGTASALVTKTTTDVPLKSAPVAQADVLLNIPAGAAVSVGPCARGWCGVAFRKYGGYVPESALALARPLPQARRPEIPVYPPYPYKAGHYPTADRYYDLPPYADINPRFYRWRYFLSARERDRYRYVPHVFHGYAK